MPAFDAFLGGELTFGISTRRIRVLVPSETQRCKLAVRLRPLTAQERCQEWLARSGFWRRFPTASAWVTDRLPKTKHWMEWRPEIALPRILIEQDAPNEEGAPANRHPPSASAESRDRLFNGFACHPQRRVSVAE